MPYIKQEDRDILDPYIEELEKNLSVSDYEPGAVTYVIYKLLVGMFSENRRYKTICKIRGILVGVLDEFNRREAHPYEDEKIQENGDV